MTTHLHSTAVLAALALTLVTPGVAADVLRVDAEALGAATGASWSDAFPSLQDALLASGPGDQLWIAAGTYRPDDGEAQTRGDRQATFQLPGGVAVFGGFAGDEISLADRAGLFAETVLDGDLLGDDDGFGFPDDNSHHVITSAAQGARLDGVRVRGGRAAAQFLGGGGLLITAGDLHVADCLFEENAGNGTQLADGGGGGAWVAGVATFERCSFRDNRAGLPCIDAGGGGLLNAGSTQLIECLFQDNRASCADPFGGLTSTGRGGGVLSLGSLTAVRCRFDGNEARGSASKGSAAFGGGLDAVGTTLLNGCRFAGNSAVGTLGLGGGARLSGLATIENCVFSGNQLDAWGGPTGSHGGGLALEGGDFDVVGSTFASNVNELAFFLFPAPGAGLGVAGGHAHISSCVLWANETSTPSDEQQLHLAPGGSVDLDHSCVQDLPAGLGGVGNLSDDPMLEDPDGADDLVGTPDDDLRLALGSPCRDAGDHTALPADTLDLDGDGDVVEASPFDAEGRERRFDDPAVADTGVGPAPVMDMGAHEAGAPFPVWIGLGQALAGEAGAPLLVGSGPLLAETVALLSLSGAAPSSQAFLVAGTAALSAPFKQGTLVPHPAAVVGPLVTDGAGELRVEGRWPGSAPSGFKLYAQVWVSDPGAPQGFAASNGVLGTAP